MTPDVVAPDEDISPSDDDGEYDVGGEQEPMPDEPSVSVENAQENHPDGGEKFERIEYLEIEPDILAAFTTSVNDESLETATNEKNEQYDFGDDQDPLVAGSLAITQNAQKNQPDGKIQYDEYDASPVKMKDDSLDMNPLLASLDADESNDCVITSAYYIQDVNVADENKN